MKTKYVITLLIVLFTFRAVSQQTYNAYAPVQNGIKRLKVGDNLPSIEIHNIYNYVANGAVTSAFDDKLLILDFGDISCGGCVAALPHMDSLQKQFGTKVAIFWVTANRRAQMQAFWTHNQFTRKLNLPVVVEDSTLRAYFRHASWPHEAWIYKGKVVAITGPDYVDAENIQAVLNGFKINWPVKDDFYQFNPVATPLFSIDTNQADPNAAQRYAAISDARINISSDGFTAGSGIVRDSVHKTIRAYFINQPILTSYLSNLIMSGQLRQLNPNQIAWEVSDRNKYAYFSKQISGYRQNWIWKNGICYESVNPDTGQTNKAVYTDINKDLDRLLGLHVRLEKRKEKVLVLVRTDSSIDIIAKKKIMITDAEGPNPHVVQNGIHYQFRDYPLGDFTYEMNQQADNPIIFDESGYSYAVHIDMDMDIPSWTAITAIRNGLKPYGLDLREEERPVEKLVFSEVNGGLLVDQQMINQAIARRKAQEGLPRPGEDENKNFMDINKQKPGVITLTSGLQYKIVRQGTGPKPGKDAKVSVNYTAMMVNGKIFESSLESGKPATFSVTGDVIPGWTEALQLMPVGSKWIIYVPSALAYQEHTGMGSFPPNSNLVFEIELLKVLK